jgi:hypothetical protein
MREIPSMVMAVIVFVGEEALLLFTCLAVEALSHADVRGCTDAVFSSACSAT